MKIEAAAWTDLTGPCLSKPDFDVDADDHSDITDSSLSLTDYPLSLAGDEDNLATVALPVIVRMTAVNILSVISLALFGVAAFTHFS
jgi:hypothetical protein